MRGLADAISDARGASARDTRRRRRQHVIAEGPGTITDKGPGGETYAPDQTDPDERYWVRLTYIKGDKVWDNIEFGNDGLMSPSIVYASNLPELENGTHLLPKGQVVWVKAWIDRGVPARIHWILESPLVGIFPVQVEKTGGADGTKTTKATWTYTVKTLGGASLGTGVAVTRPRPNGKMVFQPGTFAGGNAGYGTGFFAADGTTFILWDAGEVYTTGSC